MSEEETRQLAVECAMSDLRAIHNKGGDDAVTAYLARLRLAVFEEFGIDAETQGEAA